MPHHPDDKIVAQAVSQLADIFSNRTDDIEYSGEERNLLWNACQHIGLALNITLSKPTVLPNETHPHNLIMDIAQHSLLRIRRVSLQGEWWRYDNGPVLAFDKNNHQPLALINRNTRYYEVYDPSTETYTPLNTQKAQSLDPQAYIFYPGFHQGSLNLVSLVKFAFNGRKKDIIRLLALQTGVGLIGLLPPIATGIILETIIPNAETGMLWQWLFVLMMSLYASTLFNAAEILTIIRMRFKITAYTQAGIWDRLLRLDVKFFSQYSPGDLTLRAAGIDSIQQELTSATLHGLLGGIFSLLTLALMFYYSFWLALGAVILLAIFATLIILNSYIQLRYQRPIAMLKGKISSLTLQFLYGIHKLRVNHSEKRAFALWAKQYSHQYRLFYKSSLWQIHFSIFTNFLLLLGTLALFWLVGNQIVPLSFGHFISFNAAYAQFSAAILSFAGFFITLIRITPQYERLKPILEASLEHEQVGLSVPPLSGSIALKAVSFHYPESPWVLKDISIEIRPGETVAFVGETGCGKSTLIRLLLGFEKPISGQIFYDDHPLESLNLREVRQQLGVVLQNAILLPGTIFENIQGNLALSMDEAWLAAEQAGLAADIKAMPMGMHTLMAEAGKTLSVGQRQRLMIARALAGKPRILILDEATSALDNPTQAAIVQHLTQLNITRIIVAHRLSTLVKADRIYVIEDGKIVQAGNYETLLSEQGLFTTLARQQLI